MNINIVGCAIDYYMSYNYERVPVGAGEHSSTNGKKLILSSLRGVHVHLVHPYLNLPLEHEAHAQNLLIEPLA